MNRRGLRGSTSAVGLTGGEVVIGRYEGWRGFMGEASDGALVVVDGCGKLD